MNKLSETNGNERCAPCELALLIGEGIDVCKIATDLDCEELKESAITERMSVRELLVLVHEAVPAEHEQKERAETLIWIHDKAASEASE